MRAGRTRSSARAEETQSWSHALLARAEEARRRFPQVWDVADLQPPLPYEPPPYPLAEGDPEYPPPAPQLPVFRLVLVDPPAAPAPAPADEGDADAPAEMSVTTNEGGLGEG
mmetsp:Transcript_5167/g.15354  ORF Transcript_5167/g.15354 Transcript_5167/m.15354 type:complete len:112 (-) Transcript_5167:1163-1498(-)